MGKTYKFREKFAWILSNVFKNEICRADEEDFFVLTRMSRPVYDLLINLLEKDLEKFSIRTPKSPECRLAITLW